MEKRGGVVLRNFVVGFLQRPRKLHEERTTFLLAEVLTHDRPTTKQEF
jgi:hypothetical protein